jgi:CBS domain-containing protein
MITDRDILTRCVASSRDAHNMTAREAMSTEIHCCSGADPVEQAAAIMAKYRVRRLPVLDDKQELIGIVSLTDLTGGASGGNGLRYCSIRKLRTAPAIRIRWS